MKMETLPVDTSQFPVIWRHMDDDSRCIHPEVCARSTYARGGRHDFGAAPILGE